MSADIPKNTETPKDETVTREQKEKAEQQSLKSQHQKMLSALVTKGFDDLTDEEKQYWMSVY